jgi:hypothetical protein
MRIGPALGFWTALALGASAPHQSAMAGAARAGCSEEFHPDTLQAVTPEGDLVLASEGLSRLSGLRLPDGSVQQQAIDLEQKWTGWSVLVASQGSPDRWGRRPVRILIADKSTPFDLGSNLVEAGLAVVDPGGDPVLCAPERLILEDMARKRRLGLWADDRYNPIPVDQVDRLKERIGRFVIVEGRVRSIGERKQRTYLNFGGHWADDFTIIIPKKTWMLLAERGLSANSLKGHLIRARGILQSWQGTALAVDLPEMIERLEGKSLDDKSREETRLAR